jgi:deoxyribose-phosphate aldolase
MHAFELASQVELSGLRPGMTQDQIAALCQLAKTQKVRALCLPGSCVSQARHWLEDTEIKVITPVGFPLGHDDSDVKRFAAESAIDAGADVIELVTNYGWIKDGQSNRVYRELHDVIEAAADHPVRLVVDCYLLTAAEMQALLALPSPRDIQGIKLLKGLGASVPSVSDLKSALSFGHEGWPIIAEGPITEIALGRELLASGANGLSLSTGADFFQDLVGTNPSANSPVPPASEPGR